MMCLQTKILYFSRMAILLIKILTWEGVGIGNYYLNLSRF